MIIIIGAMKAGTSSLFERLGRHPQIAASSHKEPAFFALEEEWERGWDWYWSHFDFDPARHRYMLEASTDYTKAPFAQDVWARMSSDHDLDLRLIYIMRHPLRRLESHARHTQGSGRELGRRLSPKKNHDLDAGLSPLALAASQYAMQIDAFSVPLAQGRLRLMTLEALTEDPDREMAALWNWLGLEAPEGAALSHTNAARAKQSFHPLWRRMARQGWLMAIGRGLLPQALRARIRASFKRPLVAEGRFHLTAEEEEALTRLLAGDLARLSNDYGIDVERLWGLDPGRRDRGAADAGWPSESAKRV